MCLPVLRRGLVISAESIAYLFMALPPSAEIVPGMGATGRV